MRIIFTAACMAIASASFAQNLLTNGSFESPVIGGNFAGEGPGTDLDGWLVSQDGVDLIHSFWAAQDGDQSLDMNRDSAGAVTQTVATTPGQWYEVTFWMAGNPYGVDDKTMSVYFGGANVGDFTFVQAGHDANNIGWEMHSILVHATSALTDLSFVSTTGAMDGSQGFTSFYGPGLDNVSMVATTVPEPATLAFLGVGAIALMRRRRTR